MKHLAFLSIAVMAIFMAGCNSKDNGQQTSDASQAASAVPSTEAASEITKALNEEHAVADAEYTYDADKNTVKVVKQVEVPANQPEEDFAEAIVEHELPEFLSKFKKSDKAGDLAIRNKADTIYVSYVNKANGEEITGVALTAEDLK